MKSILIGLIGLDLVALYVAYKLLSRGKSNGSDNTGNAVDTASITNSSDSTV